MVKLNVKRIKWLIKEVIEFGKKPSDVASVYNVSARRVRQLVQEYRRTNKMPELKSNRRPKKELSDDEKALLDKVYEHHKLGAKLLKEALDQEYPQNRISKNKIYEYLKRKGISKSDKKKQRPRKRCRYERKHSGSLGHMDTHFCKWDRKLKLVTFLDDASRKVFAVAELSNSNAQTSILVLKKAIKEAWKYNLLIKAVNTDRGTEFFAAEKGKKQRKKHEFVKFLDVKGIRHIPSRVKNPQTNGKLERWHQEYEKHRPNFQSLKQFINWYNDRYHGGVQTRPNRAFINKLPQECLIGLLFKDRE